MLAFIHIGYLYLRSQVSNIWYSKKKTKREFACVWCYFKIVIYLYIFDVCCVACNKDLISISFRVPRKKRVIYNIVWTRTYTANTELACLVCSLARPECVSSCGNLYPFRLCPLSSERKIGMQIWDTPHTQMNLLQFIFHFIKTDRSCEYICVIFAVARFTCGVYSVSVCVCMCCVSLLFGHFV